MDERRSHQPGMDRWLEAVAFWTFIAGAVLLSLVLGITALEAGGGG
jgi:hypothetical protein